MFRVYFDCTCTPLPTDPSLHFLYSKVFPRGTVGITCFRHQTEQGPCQNGMYSVTFTSRAEGGKEHGRIVYEREELVPKSREKRRQQLFLLLPLNGKEMVQWEWPDIYHARKDFSLRETIVEGLLWLHIFSSPYRSQSLMYIFNTILKSINSENLFPTSYRKRSWSESNVFWNTYKPFRESKGVRASRGKGGLYISGEWRYGDEWSANVATFSIATIQRERNVMSRVKFLLC